MVRLCLILYLPELSIVVWEQRGGWVLRSSSEDRRSGRFHDELGLCVRGYRRGENVCCGEKSVEKSEVVGELWSVLSRCGNRDISHAHLAYAHGQEVISCSSVVWGNDSNDLAELIAPESVKFEKSDHVT